MQLQNDCVFGELQMGDKFFHVSFNTRDKNFSLLSVCDYFEEDRRHHVPFVTAFSNHKDVVPLMRFSKAHQPAVNLKDSSNHKESCISPKGQ